MLTLMRDPVILPTSHVRCDRAVIERHLLSDPADPFNRMPLQAEALQTDDELRSRIDAFIAEHSAKKQTATTDP